MTDGRERLKPEVVTGSSTQGLAADLDRIKNNPQIKNLFDNIPIYRLKIF
jgi:hypothetical protein